jgi:hypothetical protein
MTWVIGASSIFDYGAMMSDVRVTFSNGRTLDLLQKAYPVGPYIVAGFAGSVRIGDWGQGGQGALRSTALKGCGARAAIGHAAAAPPERRDELALSYVEHGGFLVGRSGPPLHHLPPESWKNN